MAITINSTVKEILADPRAVELIESMNPGATKDPRLKMAAGMSMRTVLGMAGFKPEEIAELDKLLTEKCK